MVLSKHERQLLDLTDLQGTKFSDITQYCMSHLMKIDRLSKEDQILIFSTMFLVMCEEFNVYPTDVLGIVDNMLVKNQKNMELNALRHYIREELK